MSVHREEARFVISIELSAEFGEDYEGDDDGYVWLERWRTHVMPRLAAAAMRELRADPGFSAVPVSRGKHPEDEMEVAVRLVSVRAVGAAATVENSDKAPRG